MRLQMVLKCINLTWWEVVYRGGHHTWVLVLPTVVFLQGVQSNGTSTFTCFFNLLWHFSLQNTTPKQQHAALNWLTERAKKGSDVCKSVCSNVNVLIKGNKLALSRLISTTRWVYHSQNTSLQSAVDPPALFTLWFIEMKTFSSLRLIGGALSTRPVSLWQPSVNTKHD